MYLRIMYSTKDHYVPLYIWLVVRYLLMFIHTNNILIQMISMIIEILHGSMWYMV